MKTMLITGGTVFISRFAAGKDPRYVNVYGEIEQRNYFSFYNYEYCLDVEKMYSLMPSTIPLEEGLKESFAWYLKNSHLVQRKPFIQYIDENLR